MNKRQRRRVALLAERLHFLIQRDRGDFDRAEAAALSWALDVLDGADRLGQLSMIESYARTHPKGAVQ